MGFPKSWLPFGETRLLTRVVSTLWNSTFPVVVVSASTDQSLPPLPPEIELTHDQRPGRGPLEGLAAGLRILQGQADAAFVTACDAPFQSPRYIAWLAEQLGASDDAVIPFADDRHQCLAALFRVGVLATVERMLDKGELELGKLVGRLRVRKLDGDQIRAVDPDLLVLRTMNTPEEYAQALATAGLPVTPVPAAAAE